MKNVIMIILLLLCNYVKAQDGAVFFKELYIELKDYVQLSENENVDRKLIKSINSWKKNNLGPDFKFKYTIEKKMFKFKLAKPGEVYNIGCIVHPNLLQRQLVFAAKKNIRWIIVYNHSLGNAGLHRKVLIIDSADVSDITLLSCPDEVDTLEAFRIYIYELSQKDFIEQNQRLTIIHGNCINMKSSNIKCSYSI